MTTPTEQAKAIVDKYHEYLVPILRAVNRNILSDSVWKAAEHCAIIAVDEIIEALGDFGYSNNSWENPETRKLEGWDEATKYWLEVKKQIEKI